MSLSFKLHMARAALQTAAPGALGKDDAAQPDCPSLQIARPSRLEPGWNLLHLSPCSEAGDISTEGASVVGLGVISMQTRRNRISSSAGYSQNIGSFLNTFQVSGMRKVGQGRGRDPPCRGLREIHRGHPARGFSDYRVHKWALYFSKSSAPIALNSYEYLLPFGCSWALFSLISSDQRGLSQRSKWPMVQMGQWPKGPGGFLWNHSCKSVFSCSPFNRRLREKQRQSRRFSNAILKTSLSVACDGFCRMTLEHVIHDLLQGERSADPTELKNPELAMAGV